MDPALKLQFPFRLFLGSEDATFLLDDGFSFSNTDPGGFEMASFSIPKDMPETIRGTYARVDCGLDVAFEGRVSQIQRSLGNKTTITCEGYGALLKDNAASMVFVDRDLTRWQDPSVTRQIALTAANYSQGDGTVAADPISLLPALAQTVSDSWDSPYIPIVESWYDAGAGNLISLLYYNAEDPTGEAPWSDVLLLSTDDVLTTSVISSNLASGGGTAGYFTPGVSYRFAVAMHTIPSTPGGAQGADYIQYWKLLTAYGNHGLTGQGSDPAGFYPSQIAAWAIAQVPGLQLGVTQDTDDTGFIVPHSVYYSPETLDQVVDDMATIGGWTWGVWDSLNKLTGDATPRCDFRPRPVLGEFTASCLRRDTTTCDVREDLSQQYNLAVVTFTNADGTSGVATATIDNPILDQAEIASRTLVLSGGTMDQATASLFGEEALAFTYDQARVAGSIEIDQAIDGGAGPKPAWMLRAGIDRLRIGDLPSFDAWGTYNDVPISRVEMSGSSEGFTTSVEVGSGADLVETLQARLASATVLAGQGG